jgi:hypothetical protein
MRKYIFVFLFPAHESSIDHKEEIPDASNNSADTEQ